MEDKIKLIFEISKLPLVDLENNSNWFKFISNFMSNSNKNTDFYFLLNFKELEILETFLNDFNNTKNTILNLLKKEVENFDSYSIYFGVFNNPDNIDGDKVIFYACESNNQVELLNNESIFFFSCFEFSEFLHINNFFSFFLDFNNVDIDKKKIKKISKQVNGVISDDNFDSINFLNINYEFLTFQEKISND